MADIFNKAINAPAGQLAEIILKKMTKAKGVSELQDDMRSRLGRLMHTPGAPGKLARIRLAADVSYLFERAPTWTKENILPLFQWSCADAADAWSSRKYSNYIGSPELFSLLKEPFLEMFERADVPQEDLRTFADWLTLVLMANKAGNSYGLTPSEARRAVRRAGAEVLSSVAHRLAIEMKGAKPDKELELWKTVVGPVFQEIWPLDAELQSRAATLQLVQLLCATGKGFSEAVDVIVPFIRSDESHSQTSIFSIANAPETLYASSPSKMLELVSAVVGDAPPASVYGLSQALSRIAVLEPSLVNTRRFQRLAGYASA